MTHRKNEEGQATIELALCIPLFVALMLLMAQVCGVLLAQLAVTQAAREGARAAAIDPRPGTAATAARSATGLNPARLSVEVSPSHRTPGEMVRVQVSYPMQISMPFSNTTLLRPVVQAEAAMLAEAP